MDNSYKKSKFYKSLTFQKSLKYLLVGFVGTLGVYQLRKDYSPANFLQVLFFLASLLFFAIFWFSRLDLAFVENVKELISSFKNKENKANRPPSYRDLIDDIDELPDSDITKDLSLEKEARQRAALFSSIVFFLLSFFV